MGFFYHGDLCAYLRGCDEEFAVVFECVVDVVVEAFGAAFE